MLTAVRPAALLLLVWFFVPLLSAQQPAPPPTPVGKSIDLDVVVTPKSGPPVAGLEQKDFTLLDNKTLQPITTFHAFSGPDAPVEVILLIDAVNTGFQHIAYERSEIDKFLRANGGKLTHPMALAIFTDAGVRTQNKFSSDGNELAALLDQETIALRAIGRSAGFYGAEDRFNMSMQALQQLTTLEALHPGRKMILWVSPGWPLLTGPEVQLDQKQQQHLFAAIVEASTELRQTRITLYNINPLGASENSLRTFYYEQFVKGVTKPYRVNVGNLSLQVLAVQSGGLVLNSSNDISAMLEQAFRDAGAWYEISFQPASAEPNEYHQIDVRVDKPGLIARTRTGYYAQP
jgi:VWFA-related protein